VVSAQALYVKTAEKLFPCFLSLVFLSDGKFGGDCSPADFETLKVAGMFKKTGCQEGKHPSHYFSIIYILCVCICNEEHFLSI
jgi:hypothetical protein